MTWKEENRFAKTDEIEWAAACFDSLPKWAPFRDVDSTGLPFKSILPSRNLMNW
jgi:hypothetical protein